MVTSHQIINKYDFHVVTMPFLLPIFLGMVGKHTTYLIYGYLWYGFYNTTYIKNNAAVGDGL
jgi:hypothetical protein